MVCDSCPEKKEVKRLTQEIFHNNTQYRRNLRDLENQIQELTFERDFYRGKKGNEKLQ